MKSYSIVWIVEKRVAWLGMEPNKTLSMKFHYLPSFPPYPLILGGMGGKWENVMPFFV